MEFCICGYGCGHCIDGVSWVQRGVWVFHDFEKLVHDPLLEGSLEALSPRTVAAFDFPKQVVHVGLKLFLMDTKLSVVRVLVFCGSYACPLIYNVLLASSACL